jgi:hypothetical protein
MANARRVPGQQRKTIRLRAADVTTDAGWYRTFGKEV